MKLKLVSNFYDYYDPWFDSEGELFVRNSISGMNRREMFSFLCEHKIPTVKNGIVKALSVYYPPDQKIVVYEDEMAHRGEGKELTTLRQALKNSPDALCSEYLPTGGVSYRYLQIGKLNFWLRYLSQNDWRSNYGDVEIEVLSIGEGYKLNNPFYAIDYLKLENEYYAVDYNIAPGVNHTGIEDLLSGRELVELLKESIIYLNRCKK